MNDFQSLIKWYKAHGRSLPWRISGNPYHIWLSEIILQQTRVEQGLPWYYAFVDRYPDVADLAAASEDEVLKMWQGLGYYSRARNLRTAAIQVCEEFDGIFPGNPSDLQKLKGVGPYTAAAIASFAYNYHAPAVDGNLIRVASRYFLIEEPVDKQSVLKLIHQLLLDAMTGLNSAEFNQALMDLGSAICTPKKPKCQECPISAGCGAREANKTHDIPLKQSKTKVKELFIWYFIAKSEDKILIRKREQKGIWQYMYDFPSVESDKPMDFDEAFNLLFINELSTCQSCNVLPEKYEHILSHRKLNVRFAILWSKPFKTAPPLQWYDKESLENLAIPRLIERVLTDYETQIWD